VLRAQLRAPSSVTPAPWAPHLQHPQYGSDDTYRLAAAWVRDCPTVSDWGGSRGYLFNFLPKTVRYLPVDGTMQASVDAAQIVADLATYREPSDGIVLRHVIDMTSDWRAVLTNAVQAFQRRMVVVTFTPDVAATHMFKVKSGWPVWHFNPDDLRDAMGDLLVAEETVHVTHPERVYYLERPCA
jgi:hypothetical protein